MEQNKKQSPSIVPEQQRSLSENLALAIKDESARRGFSVKMRVGGGIPSQRYSFDFSAAGDGTAECKFECHLLGRKGQSEKTKLAPKDLVTLLRTFERVVKLPQEQPLFLPDTIVGILEVSDGSNLRRFYFAADAEQAKTQGKVPPAELLRAVDAIYAVGAKLTGERRVKP
jgi:hypothetical protein